MKELKGELKLNTAAVERRVETEGVIVDKARAAWVARKIRERNNITSFVNKNKQTPGDTDTKNIQKKNTISKNNVSNVHNQQQARSYMRFLKEGPNRGDGCFRESTEEEYCRVMRMTFERARRHHVVQNAFSEK